MTIDRSLVLEILDDIEERRQQDAENNNGYFDYDLRCIAADVAKYGNFESRADWTDQLRDDPNSKYHKRYYTEFVFHI